MKSYSMVQFSWPILRAVQGQKHVSFVHTSHEFVVYNGSGLSISYFQLFLLAHITFTVYLWYFWVKQGKTKYWVSHTDLTLAPLVDAFLEKKYYGNRTANIVFLRNYSNHLKQFNQSFCLKLACSKLVPFTKISI